MANPLVYGGSQPNVATAPVSAVNSLSPAVPRQKNTFYMPHQVLQTERYADIVPFFVMDCISNDDVKFTSNIDQRPQSSFASPMMSSIRKHRGYVAVPKSVIYPRLWSKIFVNPKKGDDVDFSYVRCMINPASILSQFQRFWALFKTDTTISKLQSGIFLHSLYVGSLIFSPYSLLNYLEIGVYPVAMSTTAYASPVNYDFLLINALKSLRQGSGENSYINININYLDSAENSRIVTFKCRSEIDFRHAFDFMNSSNVYWPGCSITKNDDTVPSLSSAVSQLALYESNNVLNRSVNIERIIAYQMAIAQFYTSDDVDNIFTSELWYQNINGIVESVLSAIKGVPTFSYNGITMLYEPYSFYTIYKIGQEFSFNLSQLNESKDKLFSFYENIFEIHHSLRYGDMFNAARLQPLAVGDVTAPVTASNSVSAVDMTKATLMQRFLNVVNSVRNTIRGYAMSLYGVVPDDVPVEPKFVAHSVVDIGSNLVANTAEDQGALNTNLVLHDSRPEFDIHLNQDTILLGLSWYDALTVYPSPLSPFAFHVDRFDDFNPMLQNIGDQPVYTDFLSTAYGSPSGGSGHIFGYLQNDYEYKQMFGRSLGGFVTGALGSSVLNDSNLLFPTETSWAMVRNFSQSLAFDASEVTVSSDFIRSNNIEFDTFFKSLTGFGADYFHFVCSYVNEVTASRPMNYVSGVLFNSSI